MSKFIRVHYAQEGKKENLAAIILNVDHITFITNASEDLGSEFCAVGLLYDPKPLYVEESVEGVMRLIEEATT